MYLYIKQKAVLRMLTFFILPVPCFHCIAWDLILYTDCRIVKYVGWITVITKSITTYFETWHFSLFHIYAVEVEIYT